MSTDNDELKEKMRIALRRRGLSKEKRVVPSFHRGDVVNFNPVQGDFRDDSFLKDYLLHGWQPSEPQISQGTKVTAFGSCFAANITKHLSSLGFDTSKDRDPDIYISRIGDGLVNAHAIAGQFEWALENKRPPDNLWHGYDAAQFGFDEALRVRTRDVFLGTDFFIVTLGLSEIWYDETTGGVFWRAVPVKWFDSTRHKFRVTSVAETKEKIALIYSLIRQHVPKAKVLFSLSPIPLQATFRPVSCLTANSVSKSILRAALDEVIRENEADLNTRLFYFPSYEFVNELFPTRFRADNRHPHDAIVDAIMRTFEAVYCDTAYTLNDAEKLFQDVRNFSMTQLADLALEKKPVIKPKPAAKKRSAIRSTVGRALRAIGLRRPKR